MKLRTSVATFLAVFLGLCLIVHAQVKTKGDIQGTVVDANGEALPGVTITLTGEKLFAKSQTTVSNEKGLFRFLYLVPGSYSLDLSLPGFAALKIENITVNAGMATPVHATLTAEKLAKEVMVVATPPQIETKTPQILTSFQNEVVENIPTDRRFNNIMNATPGFFEDTAYGEAGQVENTGTSYGAATSAFQVNGLDVGNPNFGYTTLSPIYETIEEVQSVGIGAGAEYSNFTGAAVNIVTKSGTNQLHGSLTSVYSGKGFYGDNSGGNIALKYPAYSYDTEGSATFSGPLIKEKLFFFLAGSYMAQRLKPQTATVFERHKRPRGYAKLDWLLNSKNTFSATYTTTPTWIYDQNHMPGRADTVGLDQHVEMQVLIANWQSILSSKTFFNINFATFKDRYNIIADTPGIPQYVDYGTGWTYGSFIYEGNWPSSRTVISGILNHYADELLGASHELKLGLEYDRGVAADNYDYSGGGFYYSLPLGNGYTLWEAYTGGGRHTEGRFSTPGAFLQDNIRVGNHLYLNLGLRYETPTLTAARFTGNVVKFNNLSPRLGFSYDLAGDDRTVFHGSFGVYYNKSIVSNFGATLPGNDPTYIYDLVLPDGSFNAAPEEIKARLALIAQPQNLIGISLSGEPIPVNPDIRNMRSDVYDIGFARQLGKDLSLAVDYVYKRDGNRYMLKSSAQHTYVERQWTDPWLGKTITIWDQTDSNPDSNLVFTNTSLTKLRTHLLMFVLRKAVRGNWSMMASYVYQNSKSNLPDPEGDLFGGEAYNLDTDPYFAQNPIQWGHQWDRTHQFKLLGTYFAPLGFILSANLRVMSPRAWEPDVPSSLAGVSRSYGSIVLLLEPRGSRRGPLESNLDLRVAKSFNVRGTHLEVQADIFNVFNIAEIRSIDPHPYGLYPTGESRFGKPRYIYAPRWLRFGLTWRF